MASGGLTPPAKNWRAFLKCALPDAGKPYQWSPCSTKINSPKTNPMFSGVGDDVRRL
jgi:hypothetical protein